MTAETRCLKKAYRDLKSMDKPPFRQWARDLAAYTEVTHPGMQRDIDAARAWLRAKGGR